MSAKQVVKAARRDLALGRDQADMMSDIKAAALLDKNPWAGALIGGLVGTGVGAAGGYALQQRQASQQPPQGYYQQPPPGYSAPPPQGYGSRPQAPGAPTLSLKQR